MNPKQRAGEAAVGMLRDDMIVGLGTGSTAECFIQALAEAVSAGRLRGIRGVPTSLRSQQLAGELGIPLLAIAQAPQIDIDVDGADEIDPQLNLMKGLGGALLREKIVAQHSKRMIVVADSTKRIDVLGTRSPLPIEVVPFGHELHEAFFQALGCTPSLRKAPDGRPVVTDNGNYIYDCKFAGIENPRALQAELKGRAGVVETGLFIGVADTAIIADDRDVVVLSRD